MVMEMELKDLQARLGVDLWQESEKLEWKASTEEIKEIVRAAAAFANTKGGSSERIFFGGDYRAMGAWNHPSL